MGMRAALRIMYKEGGLLSFWRGNGINVFKIAPETAIKFTTYEEVKVWMRGDNAEITTLQRFAAGSTAGAFSQSVIYPFEVMQVHE
jgi:solute carrier family 25 phosphate transporter 23/24/25/41